MSVCARVVAGRYYKGQQISTTLIRFLDSWRGCQSCRSKKGSKPDECGADLLPFIVPPCDYPCTVCLGGGGVPGRAKALGLSLYTILQCTPLYGVGRENGGSEGCRILRKSIAVVLQPCGRCRWEGQLKGDWFVHKSLELKEYLVKAKLGIACGVPTRRWPRGWPLHDITITYSVWCMAYARGGRGCRILRNGRAIVMHYCGQCKQGRAIQG